MKDKSSNCIVVGASHAAAQLVISLRKNGWLGAITVITDEGSLPYHRPTLSKEFMLGAKSKEDILIRPKHVYEKVDVKFIFNTRVTSVDADKKHVVLSSGEELPYQKLVLTTGTSVRKLTIPGSNLPEVFYLKTIADVERIKAKAGSGKKVVIVGGGYIGLETASALNRLGMDVTILEAMDRVLQRVTTEDISSFYMRVHNEEGVKIVTNAVTTSFSGNHKVEKVICADGQEFEADLVIVGIGVIPETELAEAANVEVENGIVVDEFCQTSNKDILAAGDCTVHLNSIYQRNIRLESVQNATEQANVVAATLCEKSKAYNSLPWFWSDQYDIKLQIAGLSQGYDQVIIRGNISEGRSFAAFYIKSGKILAVDAVNSPLEFMIGKRLISENISVNLDELSDESIHIKNMIH